METHTHTQTSEQYIVLSIYGNAVPFVNTHNDRISHSFIVNAFQQTKGKRKPTAHNTQSILIDECLYILK